MEYSFIAHVEDGRLKIGLRAIELMRHALAGWRRCDVVVTIEKRHATRSLQANRYYFGVALKLLSEHTGYTVDELHEWAKAKFIPKHLALLDKNGEVRDDLVIGGTTTRLNRVEFYEYIEALRKFAAEELGVVIPDPDPNWRENADAA
jgi:hypothetical protein